MKGRWLIVMLAVLLCAGGVLLWTYGGRLFRDDDVSETYLKYKDVPGVDATFVKDFAITDNVRADITMLRAFDSLTWRQLFCDFVEFDSLDFNDEQLEKNIFGDGIGFGRRRTEQREDAADTSKANDDIIVVYRKFWTVLVCHTGTREDQKSIIEYHINQYFTN